MTDTWDRLSKARLDKIADSLLDALATLEQAAPRLPADARPPIYFPTDFDSGVVMEAPGALRPRTMSGTVLIRGGWGDDGTGKAQVQHYTVRVSSGMAYGHLTAVFLPKAKLHTQRIDVDFRWLAPGVFDVKGLDGGWRRANEANGHIQFALGAIDAIERYCRTNPMLFLALDPLAIQVPCAATFARRLLSSRDKDGEKSRRSALRHFVDHYFRDQETKSGDDEVWVRKHLRGGTECVWGGFTALLRPPAAWQEEHEEWVEARDAYRSLPAEDRAAARDLIRSTYGLNPKELDGAMMGD